MATDLAQYSKADLANMYSRAKAMAKNMREKGETFTQRGMQTLATGAGAFAGGMLEHRMPEFQGLPTTLVLGTVLSVAGAADMAGKQSEHLLSFGNGILASGIALKGFKFSEELDL